MITSRPIQLRPMRALVRPSNETATCVVQGWEGCFISVSADNSVITDPRIDNGIGNICQQVAKQCQQTGDQCDG